MKRSILISMFSPQERRLFLREAVLTRIVNKAFLCGEVYICQDQILLTENNSEPETETSSVRSSSSLPSLPRSRNVPTQTESFSPATPAEGEKSWGNYYNSTDNQRRENLTESSRPSDSTGRTRSVRSLNLLLLHLLHLHHHWGETLHLHLHHPDCRW